MIVRFAELCDKCGKPSPEYSTWAYCLESICDACRVPNTTIDADLDSPESCLCWECNNYE